MKLRHILINLGFASTEILDLLKGPEISAIIGISQAPPFQMKKNEIVTRCSHGLYRTPAILVMNKYLWPTPRALGGLPFMALGFGQWSVGPYLFLHLFGPYSSILSTNKDVSHAC